MVDELTWPVGCCTATMYGQTMIADGWEPSRLQGGGCTVDVKKILSGYAAVTSTGELIELQMYRVHVV